MLKNDKVLALALVITVLLGGCNEGTDNVKSTEAVVQAVDKQEISMNTEDLVSVQNKIVKRMRVVPKKVKLKTPYLVVCLQWHMKGK